MFKWASLKPQPHGFSRWYNNQIAGWMVFFKRETDAIQRYRASVQLFDGDVKAKNCLANLYAQQGTAYAQPAAALALFDELVKQQPSLAAHPFNAGFIRQTQGEHRAAMTLFNQALALDPNLDRAWYGLGLSLIALGDLPPAIEALKRNTALQPMSPYGWYQLAMAQAHAGLWEQAVLTAKHLHTFEPKFARGLKIDLNALKLKQKGSQAELDTQLG